MVSELGLIEVGRAVVWALLSLSRPFVPRLRKAYRGLARPIFLLSKPYFSSQQGLFFFSASPVPLEELDLLAFNLAQQHVGKA